MTKDDVINDYFEWLCNLIFDRQHTERISYKKLLMLLHNTEFRYSILHDENRADDGVSLRYRYACAKRNDELCDYLTGPCSVLEMMIALSVRCEEHIMDDPEIGDRTGQWFWTMVVNLGIGSMSDKQFNKQYVEECIRIFLDREYAPDGEGGLFTVENCKYDLRTVEIWYQMCWYLSDILNN